ncbi:methionine biosynthesis protein MetW [Candidatus Deianiraea vastatrix]|uniref:MetW-like methionine biosynthesis protein n=1 Tax=Candidatus Deianiraea vastatrix TaxID=2163644 RepID=A0A5B8XH30_9RICK|nr:methionine biosynthesis protein MetW [Candidatus Deianiraea vastatrix]QED23441.1 Putative MetW-like methionine biosynthesis protein [Candidatus Deianiraea vastatrix]
MKIIHNISEKILKSRYHLSDSVMAFYNDIILTYDSSLMNCKNIISVNLRESVIQAAKERDKKVINLQIGHKIQNDSLIDKMTIEINETLLKYQGSTCDLVVIDSCIEYTINPVQFLLSAFKLSENVVCVIQNYATLKRRFHFMLTGSYQFLDIDEKNRFDSNIYSPFSINDFLRMCDKEHIFVKYGFYLNRKGKILNIFGGSTMMPNLHIDEAVFVLNKF